jgi:hypothetical protein
MSTDVKRDLEREAEAARALLENLGVILADDDSDDVRFNTVAGETALVECIGEAVHRLNEIEALHEGIEDLRDRLTTRLARLDRKSELIRTALASAIEATGLKKIELPAATISLKAVPPSVQVISEADIPPQYWKPQDPKLDRRALLEALRKKQSVPGAALSNGGVTISIRQG